VAIQSAQIERLTDDHVPTPQRGWVNDAVLLPLNKVLDLLRAFLNRGVSLRTHINCQLVERKFTPPTSSADYQEQLDWTSSRFDTPLALSGPILGVQVLGCWTLDGGGHDVASVSGLAAPSWREVIAQGSKVFRLVYVPGLTSGTKYRLLLLLWGQ